MSGFPASPKVTKGAIVGIDPMNPMASVVIFQYNPEELTRSLKPKGKPKDESKIGTRRLTRAPEETITLKITIDAANQLQTGDSKTAKLGVYPQLAAMEMLVYPKSLLVIANTVLAALGTMEIEAPTPPLTLFVWGLKRVVPVRLTSYSVTEKLHDPKLNPIVAEASLTLEVLTYDDFMRNQAGYYMFLAYQMVKEAMAVIGTVSNLSSAGVGNILRK